MFRYRGKRRTFKQNLSIASLLSFVAGIVNVAGFLAVQRLTTNVTGHFAFFIEEVFNLEWRQGLIYFLYILFFFFGSFLSSYLVEMITLRSARLAYVIPIFIESIILFFVALNGESLVYMNFPNTLACILLFAMGLQNSLVTSISNATVRTTHLTGLITDLGIELSQLFFYREKGQKAKLMSSIVLRLTIVLFFFIGGIIAGIFYSSHGLNVLFIGSATLFIGIIFDQLKLKLFLFTRRFMREAQRENKNY